LGVGADIVNLITIWIKELEHVKKSEKLLFSGIGVTCIAKSFTSFGLTIVGSWMFVIIIDWENRLI